MRRLTPWLSLSRCWNGWLRAKSRDDHRPARRGCGPRFLRPTSRTPHPPPARASRTDWSATKAGRAPGGGCRPFALPHQEGDHAVAAEGGVAGGALPMSAGTSFHGRKKPNGSACHRRIMAGVQDAAKHAIRAMSPLKSCEVEKPQPQRRCAGPSTGATNRSGRVCGAWPVSGGASATGGWASCSSARACV
jgi:hypothetical protein